MFDIYAPEIKALLIQLKDELAAHGKTPKATSLCKQLRTQGLLSLPFSMNTKKLGKIKGLK
jgi:hypothetical protein